MNSVAVEHKLSCASYNQDQQLKLAVQSADIKCVEKLIANGSDVNFIYRRLLQTIKIVTKNKYVACLAFKEVTPLIDSIELLVPNPLTHLTS